MIKPELTKDEARELMIQIGERINQLVEQQKEAGKDGNVKRVIEMEKFLEPIRSGLGKIEKEYYK